MEFNKNQLDAINTVNGNLVITAVAGSGKALKNGTKILTENGFVNIENLHINDKIYGDDGLLYKTLGVFPQGKKEVYKLTFSDNTEIQCCNEHLWTYQTSGMRNRNKWDTKPLKDLINLPIKLQSGKNEKWNLYIPMCKPVQFNRIDVPIEPYTLGVLLGNGCLRKRGNNSLFSSEDKDVVERVIGGLSEIGYTLKKINDCDYRITGNIKQEKISTFVNILEELKLDNVHSYTKFIPDEYLYNSVENRFSLLQGLIDTDGYCCGSQYEYSTTSKQLAENVQFLCESLGLTAIISIKDSPTYTYNDEKLIGATAYRVFIKPSSTFPKIHKSNKRESQYSKSQSVARRYIKKIEKTGELSEMTCIMVSNPSNLFITEHFIVTHNTSVLTHRILNLIQEHDINPQDILAVTFSKKAKENMSERLDKLTPFADRINIETFHSLALKIIQSEYGNKYKVWTTQWEKESCMGDICNNLGLCAKEDTPYNEIMIFIAKQKTNMLKPDDKLIYLSSMPFNKDDMKQIYSKYEEYKSLNNLIEFDDFLNMACDIFHDDKDLLKNYQNRFQYILSDEFQDVSMNQALLIEYLGKSNNNTFIVGDILQAIYSFRGGQSKYMSDFDKEWDNVKVINLNKNYRCSSDIVDVANEFAKCIPESKHRNYALTVADKPYYKKPTFNEYTDSYKEGSAVANKIKKLCLSGYDYKDFAILGRTNAQLQKLETTLHNNGVPFGIVDGKLFTEQLEIQLLLSYLRLSIDTNNNDAFRYLYNKPLRWLSKKFLQEVEGKTNSRNKSLYDAMFMIDRRNWRFKNGIDEIHDVINKLQNKHFKNVGEMIKYLRNTLQIDEFVSKGNIGDDGMSEQTDNMDSFQDICKEYKTIPELLAYLDDLNKSMSSNISDKVKLMTIHKSKGLEFPVVFIVGCSDGLLPHFKTNDINEEKKLMYVAITRAEKELYFSSAKLYNDRILGVSPFINDMGETIEKNKNEENKYNENEAIDVAI